MSLPRGCNSFGDVLGRVRNVVNGPFPPENALRDDERIFRRRDSACICLSARGLREEFPEENLEPRFIFEHDTIEMMAQSLCGRCDCPYCKDRSKELSAPEPTYPQAEVEAAQQKWTKATFTQLTELKPSEAPVPEKVEDIYAQLEPGRYVRKSDGIHAVLIPAATVWVGADTLARAGLRPLPCETPCHQVPLSSFLMDVEPVSIGAYARFLNATQPAHYELLDFFLLSEQDERKVFVPLQLSRAGQWEAKPGVPIEWPMFLVSWYGANAYSLWVHGADWKSYKFASSSFLPTEAQWEYAARGASPACFPWGDDDATPELLQVNWQNTPVPEDLALDNIPLVDVTVQIGVSRFGLRQMAGSMWQWCRDSYDQSFYQSAKATEKDAWNAEGLDMKAERGGSWVGPACLARSSYRRGRVAVAKGRCLGFRCVAPASMVLGAAETGADDSTTASHGIPEHPSSDSDSGK